MIIFVGDKPSRRMAQGAKPFEGAKCEARLLYWICQLLTGHAVEDKDYRIINACDYIEGFKVINDNPKIMEIHNRDYCYIALGNNASKALKNIPHYKLPHPSLRNRQLNNKKFIAKKLKECKDYIKKNI